MPVRSLTSFFFTADELLAADLPKLGEALLVHLNSYDDRVKQRGMLNRDYLLAMLESRNVGLGTPPPPEYGARQHEVNRAVIEAWQWLEAEGMLMRATQTGEWFTISRKGEELLRRHELYERSEKYGVELVKADLVNNAGRRVLDVGSRSQTQEIALERVAVKENELKMTGNREVSQAEGQKKLSRRIFVVHGHDEAAREKIARFLERMEFEPIILHEQASRGRTVIEKVEAHSDVGFAVVLLTPDDEGCERGGTPRPRARQNVVLELGYFIGRLGRTHVCALKRGELEIPSDFEGVVYVVFDDSDGWKQALARELEAAGFEVDRNKGMGSRT